MKTHYPLSKLGALGILTALMGQPVPGRSDNNAAMSFSGQAIIATVTNNLVGPLALSFGDTGLLPAAGGDLEVKVPFTNIMDSLFIFAAKAKTKGAKDHAQSKVELADFAILLTSASGDDTTVFFESLQTSVKAECKGTGVVFKSEFDLKGLRINGDKVHVSDDTNQSFSFSGGSIVLNSQTASVSGASGEISANAVTITLDTGLTVVVGAVSADVTCLPPIMFAGEALALNLQNAFTGPSSIFSTDTGALPTSGGDLEIKARGTNVPGVFSFSSATAKTETDDNEVESKAEINNFSLTFTTVDGASHILSFKKLEIGAKAKCGKNGPQFDSDVDFDGLKLDGTKVSVSHDANQIVQFAGGYMTINAQLPSTTTNSADLLAAGIFITLDSGGLSGSIGWVHAGVTCPTP